MRLWHYKLIPVLPRQQLLGQWRELCAMAKMIYWQKSPNNPIVNKVMGYPFWMFMTYQYAVEKEFFRRGYRISDSSRYLIYDNTMLAEDEGYFADQDDWDWDEYKDSPFPGWHNDRYLIQCYFNLEEKHDCGLISDEEFEPVFELVTQLVNFL